MNPSGAGEAWTRDHLLEAAAREGLAASGRLLREWTQLGLLDRPTVRNLQGRRGREPGTWDERQARLFLELLRVRARQPEVQNAALANLVVWLWLTEGDAYVPTRQVRRALATWADRALRSPTSGAMATARSVVSRLADRAAGRAARGRLRDVIARAQVRHDVPRAAVISAAAKAFDPSGADRPRGPEGAVLTAKGYTEHTEAMVAGANALREARPEGVPDDLLHEARVHYLATRIDYARMRPKFARDSELGHLHEPGTLGDLVNDACRDVVLLVGRMIASADWRRRPPPRQR